MDKKQYLINIIGATKAEQFLDAAAKREKESQMIFIPDPNRYGYEICIGSSKTEQTISMCLYCGTKDVENDFICKQCGAPL